MQTFDMPEFYIPYPARCNPHRESAQVHAKTWATQMGMLNAPPGAPGAGVWDEHEFDSADFPLYAALSYPDASASELNLLTDWHVWAWFFDDFFLETFTRRKDLPGGQEYVSRLVAHIPTEVAGTPEPTNPVESGLANLWMRTVATVSAEWQAKLAGVVQVYLQNTLQEIDDTDHGWAPNPINYVIDVRRKAGGMNLVACLIEHAHGVEVSSEIASTRPLSVLKDTFADAVGLRNDILSYRKELCAGEINGVMVAERFLGCGLQRAVDIVNELVTSRMQQFENTALIELPLLFEDCKIDLKMRLEILLYVKGFQDCMAGDLEWHKRTSRYENDESPGSPPARKLLGGPTGIGTAAAQFATWKVASRPTSRDDGARQGDFSWLHGPTGIGTVAARLGLARRAASVAWLTTLPTVGGEESSRAELPEFYMPFEARNNPHAEIAGVHAKAWAVEMGMLGSGLADWDESGFDAGEYARLVALIYPDASAPDLALLATWWTWAQFLADFTDEIFQRRRDLAGAKAAFDRLAEFMPISLNGVTPVPISPVERGLADLWHRTAPAMSENWRRWFSGALMGTFRGLLWKIFNFIENRIPDPVDYIEMRRQTCGGRHFLLLIHYVFSLDIRPEIHNARPMCALIESLLDWDGLFNDVFSYRKEIECEGRVHNGVVVIQRFLGCDLQQAVNVVNDLATSQLRHFEHIIANELPDFITESGLDVADRENIDRYVHGLQDWIGGYFQIHLTLMLSRYKLTDQANAAPAEDTPPTPAAGRLPSGPTGLGIAATRIGAANVPTPALAPGSLVRLSFSPTGIGTAAVRIGLARDAGGPEPPPDPLGASDSDVPAARLLDVDGVDGHGGVGLGSVLGS